MSGESIPKATLERLPGYLNFLRLKNGPEYASISSATIAQEMNLAAITVRKDLAFLAEGRPRVGHSREELIDRITEVLGSGGWNTAVLAGVGNLGRALLSYEGFEPYGMSVAAGFDANSQVIGESINQKPVYHIDEMQDYIRSNGVSLGIIAVPAQFAQDVCDRMVSAGIRGILNFAPVHLSTPPEVLVRHEDFAVSLALLAVGMEKRAENE